MSLDNLIWRCSDAAPLFTGTDGLTDAQLKKLTEYTERIEASKEDPKKRLTDNMWVEFNDLSLRKNNFDNGIIELQKGAKTYIEKKVKEVVYGYKPAFAQNGNRYTEKGNMVEDDAINLINMYFMKFYEKSTTHLKKGRLSGHPDVEDADEMIIVDNKSSWTKETFPALPEDIDSSLYEWQGKLYCYLKGWRKYRLVYTLMSTPEGLVPEWEGDDLHYVEDLPIGLRITYVDYVLTDDEIAHIERRLAAAEKYAVEYYNKLMAKCTN